MAVAEETRRIVPRGDLEGSLGSGEKRWEKAYVGNVGNVYNSVADMKADLELMEGSTVVTKGYHAINDGGHGFYNIREKEVSDVHDGGSIIFLDNGRVAELIVYDTINVKQFGAKGDGVTDDTNAFRNALLVDKLYIPAGDYVISDYLIGTNEVKDEGTYVNLKPIFKTKNVLKNIEQFACQHDFVPTGYENMYGECMTYDTKRQKIILSFYWYTAPTKNVFLVLNKDTYAVEQTIDAPFPYAFNVLSYNEQDDTIYANGGNTAYIFDAGDLTSYTTFTIPENGNHAVHDNITGVDVVAVSNWGTDKSFTLYIYSNNFGTLLRTVQTKAGLMKDYAFQDVAAYNGKVYLMTWENLFEIDMVTGDANDIGIGTIHEFEGIDFIDGELFVFLHQAYTKEIESIYKYIEDGSTQFYDRLPGNNIHKSLDVSLNNLLAMGDYMVETPDNTNKNYPTGEIKGYVRNIVSGDVYNDVFTVDQEFISLVDPYYTYRRKHLRDLPNSINTWTDWVQDDEIDSQSSTSANPWWIRYKNGLQIVGGRKAGIVTSQSSSGPLPYLGNASFTYPKPFKFSPQSFVSCVYNPARYNTFAGSVTGTSANLQIAGNISYTDSTSVEYLFIGRWK